jgi:two-component system phosphate regulon sensor histidine kinase PhoR
MFSSFRAVALLLGISISIVTIAFLSLFEDVPVKAIIVTAIISFSISYLLIYLAYRYFIFNEITRINQLLTKITDQDLSVLIEEAEKTNNPIKKLSTEISRYAKVKEEEVKELRKMESYRKEFFADVSHELKTPLFAAQGFIHTLLDGAISDKNVRSRFLKKAGKSLSRLDKLVQDLLTISQMETGNITMYYSHFNIYNLVQEVFDQLDGKAEKKSLKLCFYDNCPTGIYAHADKQKISQVLLNLVSNAINYTKETDADIAVDLVEDKASVRIIVKDNGVGIPSSDINRIFERFYRVEKSRAKDRGGIGLGLAIVKHILEAHNQKIIVESEMGVGSVFAFNLQKGIKEKAMVEEHQDR